MIRISLIVPTYNRSKYLYKSLPSFVAQSLSKEFYEVLIIDNNSSDNTKQVIEEIMSKSGRNWKYIFVQEQGLHCARNKGIIEAKGDIVVFGDDDIMADNNWLKTILDEFDSNPATGIVGGKILPLWEVPPAEWIYDYGTDKIHPIFAYLDYGDNRIILQKEYVYGCNFAIRKDLVIKIGGSPPDTFPKRLKHLSGLGENIIIDKIRELGHKVVFLPKTCVSHMVDSNRISLEYFIDRYERATIEKIAWYFREFSKYKAVYNTMIWSLKWIFPQLLGIRRKKNKINYFIISYRIYIQIFRQLFRVLSDQKLYRYITAERCLID